MVGTNQFPIHCIILISLYNDSDNDHFSQAKPLYWYLNLLMKMPSLLYCMLNKPNFKFVMSVFLQGIHL